MACEATWIGTFHASLVQQMVDGPVFSFQDSQKAFLSDSTAYMGEPDNMVPGVPGAGQKFAPAAHLRKISPPKYLPVVASLPSGRQGLPLQLSGRHVSGEQRP